MEAGNNITAPQAHRSFQRTSRDTSRDLKPTVPNTTSVWPFFCRHSEVGPRSGDLVFRRGEHLCWLLFVVAVVLPSFQTSPENLQIITPVKTLLQPATHGHNSRNSTNKKTKTSDEGTNHRTPSLITTEGLVTIGRHDLPTPVAPKLPVVLDPIFAGLERRIKLEPMEQHKTQAH